MPKLLTLITIILLFVSACASSAAPTEQASALSVEDAEDAATAVPPTDIANPEPVNVAQSQADNTAVSQTTETNEALVARVNGVGIGQAAFDRALARAQQQIIAADPAALETMVLDTLIEQALIEQAAAADNVVISEEMLEAEYQANRSLVESDAQWQQWLDENLYTEAEFRESLRAAMIAGMMRDKVTQTIPDSLLHVHARHILVDSEQAANEALARLQNGEDFGTLAANLSRDVTTRDQSGDLGWFVEGELLEPVLSQVAFSLEDGQIGGPVATRLGYHIIQKLGSEERSLTPERRALLSQIHFENWLRGLSFNAIIERYLS